MAAALMGAAALAIGPAAAQPAAAPEPAAVPQPAEAAEPDLDEFGAFIVDRNNPNVILLNGPILSSAVLDFRRVTRAYPDIRVIALNSPGGALQTGLAIADDVFEGGYSTIVPPGAGCYSACAFIFFGGVERIAIGELGVHQFRSNEPDLVLAQQTMADVFDFLGRFDTPPGVISVMLRTPPDDMYVFTAAEIEQLEINRGFAGGVEAYAVAETLLAAIPSAIQASAPAILLVEQGGDFREIEGEVTWGLEEEDGNLLIIAEAEVDGMEVLVIFGGVFDEDGTGGLGMVVRTDGQRLPGGGIRGVEGVNVITTGDELFRWTTFFPLDDEELADGGFFLGSHPRWLDRDLALFAAAMTIDLVLIDGNGDRAILRLGTEGAQERVIAEGLTVWAEQGGETPLGDLPELETSRIALFYEGADTNALEGTQTWYLSGDELAVRLELPGEGYWIDLAFSRDGIFLVVEPPGRFDDGPDIVARLSVDSNLVWTVSEAGVIVADLATADPNRMRNLLNRGQGIDLELLYADGTTVNVFIDKGATFNELLAEAAAIWAEAPAGEAVAGNPLAGNNPPLAPALPDDGKVPGPAPIRLPTYSLPPTYGSVTLRTGFLPDPHTVPVVSGGPIDASAVGNGCVGFVADAPDFRLNYTAGDTYPLIIAVLSDADTTLLVNDPSGNWHCDDDGGGDLNPLLRWDRPLSGQYDIWVGTYVGPTNENATLYITEVGLDGEDEDPAGEVIANYTDWSVVRTGEDLCVVVTLAVASSPRNPVDRMFLGVYPASGNRAVPYLRYYEFTPNRQYYFTAVVDGQEEFNFDPEGTDEADMITLEEQAQATDLVAAMRRGLRLVVHSVTAADVNQTDTFSLLGFTAALARARQECPDQR